MQQAAPADRFASAAGSAAFLTRGRTFLLLALYFLLQTLFRVWVSDSVELDESEQVLCSQAWLWGYGSDPPLYTWLQILVFNVFGLGVPALAILKNGLLASAFGFTYLSLREIERDDQMCLLGTLSLFLFPQITWESQRDLTHSVLASALTAATLWVALRVWKTRSPQWYMLLGLVAGLGVLSKHSYSILAAALLIAALTTPELRGFVLNRWTLLSAALVVLVAAMHARWIFASPEAAFRRTHEVLRATHANWMTARLEGLGSLLKCAVMLGGVLGVVYAFCFGRPALNTGPTESGLVRRYVVRTILVLGLVCTAIVLVSGVELKDRWFQPLVFLLAIWAALAIQARLATAGLRRFLCILAAIAATALIVLPAIPVGASITGRPTRLNAPYSALATTLQQSGPTPSMIIGGTRLVGGNLRLHFPEAVVLAPDSAPLPLRRRGPMLVVWDATKNPAPPEKLVVFMRRLTGDDISALESTEAAAPMKYAPKKTMRVRYIRLAGWKATPAR